MEANNSLWSATATTPTFPPLEADMDADVLVVGGGITGLTATLLLALEGKSVVCVEARRIGSGVSERSTNHLTEAVDTRYHQIASSFGKEGAKLVAQSSRAAIEKVAELSEAFSIPSGFFRRSGYLYTESEEDVEKLHKEHEAAQEAGLPVEMLGMAPLTFPTRAALHFPDQAQFQIQRYLAGVAAAAQSKGAHLFEETRVTSVVDGEPCVAQLANGKRVRAKTVFVATHRPLNRVFLQTKIASYQSYVLAFRDVAIPDGLFWDTADPYHYFSSYTVDGTPYLVVGGEDHKTGTTPHTPERFDALLGWVRERVKVQDPTYRWSAQVEEPVDGLPYIGRSSMSENVLVATGFSGNGTTFGTIAAMIVRDHVMDRTNPWATLYTATRIKPLASAASYTVENIDFPMHFLSDRLHPPEAKSVQEIAKGEGKHVRVHGERLAVYRDPEGALHGVSCVCTHLGCLVKFNAAEKTWDCPCHGARFGVDGEVLGGPAVHPLAKKDIEPARNVATSGEEGT